MTFPASCSPVTEIYQQTESQMESWTVLHQVLIIECVNKCPVLVDYGLLREEQIVKYINIHLAERYIC